MPDILPDRPVQRAAPPVIAQETEIVPAPAANDAPRIASIQPDLSPTVVWLGGTPRPGGTIPMTGRPSRRRRNNRPAPALAENPVLCQDRTQGPGSSQ
jgi:hypothetical protein